LDLCHVDEAGFALTLPTSRSWGPVGVPLQVPYEAPQGRRLNVIGGYFSHGPLAGTFEFASFASLPKSRSKTAEKTLAQRAAEQDLSVEEVGVIDSEVFLGFVWHLAGRPGDAPVDWRRERPLVVAVDNYQAHKSDRVKAELAKLHAADIYLFYLPPYSPELSAIEPIWHDVKYHQLTERSHAKLGGLKQAAEGALLRKALELRERATETAPLLC
jgi:transposase